MSDSLLFLRLLFNASPLFSLFSQLTPWAPPVCRVFITSQSCDMFSGWRGLCTSSKVTCFETPLQSQIHLSMTDHKRWLFKRLRICLGWAINVVTPLTSTAGLLCSAARCSPTPPFAKSLLYEIITLSWSMGLTCSFRFVKWESHLCSGKGRLKGFFFLFSFFFWIGR